MLAPLGVLGSAWACFWLTDEELWQGHPLAPFGLQTTRLLLLGTALLLCCASFVLHVVRPGLPMWWRRCWALGLCTGLCVLSLEVAFMFVPKSHNVGYTLANRIWFARHWEQPNALGYRDGEHVRLPGRQTVFALGDSFTAGAGVAHRQDRFGDLLEAQAQSLHVLNLGRNGSDTSDEFRRLLQHPLTPPDAVVLQYYPNDIEGAAVATGHPLPHFQPYEDIPSVKARFVVRGSYLANFAYWQFQHSDSRAYVEFLEHMLADAEVMARHLHDLEAFCTYATERHTTLVVVLFPILTDLQESRQFLAPVKALFDRHRVPVVDVTDLVQDLDVGERIVNHLDVHASTLVHRRVAEALVRVFATH